ncbi:MAG: BTAD domain-containing putative transcriptional regulator [Caldilineaceae bacterium]
MPVPLQIQLLGSFAVKLDDQPIHSFRSAKARALLAFLAAQPEREHPRAAMATLLWGDLPDAAAKTNLRVELSNLKKLLGDHPGLVITRNTVRVDSLLVTVDAVNFHERVSALLALPAETQATQLYRLSAALDDYGGDFLVGFHLDDSPDFDDWQRTTREHLHELMMQALETLQIRHAEQARWDELAEAARRQLAAQPWHEPAHRRLIQALAAQGKTQAALAQYESCRAVLAAELGVEPSAETADLVARLRGDTSSPPPVRHNLPPQLKSFVGRSAEIERLGALVQSERLVTLLGIGGVGKSRLAQTVAQQALHRFAQGVWFVPLTNITAGDAAHQQIALAVAAAVGLQVTDTQTPLRELIPTWPARRCCSSSTTGITSPIRRRLCSTHCSKKPRCACWPPPAPVSTSKAKRWCGWMAYSLPTASLSSWIGRSVSCPISPSTRRSTILRAYFASVSRWAGCRWGSNWRRAGRNTSPSPKSAVRWPRSKWNRSAVTNSCSGISGSARSSSTRGGCSVRRCSRSWRGFRSSAAGSTVTPPLPWHRAR